MYVYIYIYIRCSARTWSNNSLFLRQNLVQCFSVFFVVFQRSSSFCRENDILKKNEHKKMCKKHLFLSLNLVQLCCATYLDQTFDSTLDQVLTQHFANFWVFLPFWNNAETTIFIVFSAKNENFKPTPKNWRTLFVNTTALTVFFCPFFLHFCFFGVFAVSGFLGGLFLRGMKTKKRQNSKQNNKKTKKEEGPQDANKKTT